MRISQSLGLFGALVAVGFTVAMGIQGLAFYKLRINGGTYETIVAGKDAIADTAPPPLYLIESYALALETQFDPDHISVNAAKLSELERAYSERMAHWLASDLSPDLKALLSGPIGTAAAQFWKQLDEELLPRLREGDTAGGRSTLLEMEESFRRHDEAIRRFVAQSDAFLKEREREAAEQSRFHTMLSLGAVLASLALLGGGLFWFYRREV